jgi:hypothetical protein
MWPAGIQKDRGCDSEKLQSCGEQENPEQMLLEFLDFVMVTCCHGAVFWEGFWVFPGRVAEVNMP